MTDTQLALAPIAERIDINGRPDANFTVAEAVAFLPMLFASRKLLSQLGKDCSMVCRIRNETFTQRATPHQPWPTERAYPAAIIREVFILNPETAPYLPK